MTRMNKKHFKILPLSVVGLLILALIIGIWQISPVEIAKAAAVNAATKTDVTPGTQFTTAKGVPVFRLLIANSGDAADAVTTLAPTPSGSVDDTIVTLHFFKDTNNNGIVDSGDTDLGASAAFTANDTKQTFNITDVTVAAGGNASILITADIAGETTAHAFTLGFAAAADIAMSVTPTGTFPMNNANALTISDTAPAVTVANGADDPAAKTAKASATNIAVKQLAISAAAGTSDSIISLAPTPSGTENDNTNITSVVFYIDSGSVPGQVDGTDVQLVSTPATYTADDTLTTFTFSNPIQIAASATVNILTVYNLGAGVTNTDTLATRIAAAGDAVAGSGTAVTQSSTISATITIDTDAPVGTAAVDTDPIYTGDYDQVVTITYSEEMNPAITPIITFTGNIGSLVSNSDGVWSDGDTIWTESFTQDGTSEATGNVQVVSSGATDLAGNIESASVLALFDIDTELPTLSTISIVSDNSLDATLAKAGDKITLSFTSSEAISEPVVIFSSGGDTITGSTIPTNTAGNDWTVDYYVDPDDTEGSVTFTLDYADLAGNDGLTETTVDDATSVTVDLTAPNIDRITAKTQSGAFPASDSVIWYNYTGDTLEGYIEGDEPLSEIRICVRSLKEADASSQTCDDTDFSDAANYITSGPLAANSYTFTGTTFSSIAGANPLVDMTGYTMNVYIADAAGNITIVPDPAQSFVMVYNVEPSAIDASLDNATTTSWASIDDFTDVTGLTFRAENTGTLLGEISFPGSINLTDSATVEALQDFASNVLVGGGDTADGTVDIGVNATALAALNQPADIIISVPGATGQPGLIVYDDTGTRCGAIADDAVSATVCGDDVSAITWDDVLKTLSFSTTGFSSFGADTTPPTVASYSPADNATGVAINSNLVLTFNENVRVGTGNIVIKKTSDNSVVETIAITGARVTFNGTTGVTIDPTQSLMNNTAYYIQIANTAILDSVGNAYAGISNTTTWNFVSAPGTGTGTGSSGGGGGAVLDVTPPTNTSISINSGAAETISQAVNLTLGATDAASMMISNSSDFFGGAWETFATTKAWTLTADYGTKTVYAKFRDSANNISSTTSDAISYVATATSPSSTTPATPSVQLPGQVSSVDSKTGITTNYYDPTDKTNLLAGKNLVIDASCESTYKPLLTADAKSLKVTLSADQLDQAITFVCYGISSDTDKLGAGERRAQMRDYWQTTGYSDTSWDDIARNASGQKYVHRNLKLEQAQVGTALVIFRKIFGHNPNFSVSKEDMTWNTILYRLRFVRDLSLEKAGILKFRSLFKYTPSTPLDWAVVRALGYIE